MDARAVFFTFFLGFIPIRAFDDAYREELYVKPLQNGHVYSYFQFTTLWNESLHESDSFAHYHLFPKSLGEVLRMWNVEELHLSQTQGLWRWDKWGYPVQDAPPGAKLWVWFHKNTHNVDKAWKNLINVLSGMFCASLNFLDASNTITPKWSLRPEGVTSHGGHEHFLRYGSLPREVVCTENMTPWKKLLPCGSMSGLRSLFSAIKMYDASYHSLGLHVRSVCADEGSTTKQECTRTAVELKQTLSVVFEPPVQDSRQDWTFKKMYGRMMSNVCPLAESSKVYVDLSSNKTAEYFFNLTPEPTSVETYRSPDNQRGKMAVYNIPDFVGYGRVMNVAAKYNKRVEYKEPKNPLVYAHQYQTGYGQEKGGVVCFIYNRDETNSIPVLYLQSLPWYLRLYIHTLTIDHFPAYMNLIIGAVGNTTLPRYMHYVPGRDHQQPYHLEIALNLPPNTVTRLSFQFERALLKWTEYPPDANHGFYVNSAVITTPLPSDLLVPNLPKEGKIASMFSKFGASSVLRVHTETLLVSLPTPDFSMPYNVICLACTVVAIAFGSMHNLTTRRFVVLDPNKKGLVGKLKSKLAGIFSRSKKIDAKNDTDVSTDTKDKQTDKGDKES